MLGFTNSISSMQQLYYLLRGIRRSQGSVYQRSPRQPITVTLLQRVIIYIDQHYTHIHDRRMLISVVTMAFFGLLRSSEYTCSSRTSFNRSSTLMFQDVSISPTLTVASIHLRGSKTDPFRLGCTIRIGSTGNVLCPVRALYNYMMIHPQPLGPLFIFSTGAFLIRADVIDLLRVSLPGMPLINTHSFRIGGASAAASAGVPDSTIQILGRWSSDAYRRYLRISDETVCDISSRLSRVVSYSRFWDSDVCASQGGNIT